MSEWKEVQIKNIVLGHRPVTYGIVQPGPDIRPDGIPLIRGKDYSSGKVDISDLYHVRPEIDIPYKRSKVLGGDILFSIAGYVGQVAVVPKRLDGANITQTTARISVDLYSYCSEYIFYYLISDLIQTQVRKYAKGSAQEGLNLSDVEKIKIKFPDYSIQRKIARILSTADAVIEKTQAGIAKYKAIKQGMLHDLFTRGIDPTTGKLRPTYEDVPELYKESKLGWIPKEWEVEKLENICSMKSGDGITSLRIRNLDDYPVYGGNGLRGFTNSFTHDGEYTLIGRQGALCGNITRVGGKFYASEHAVVVTVKGDIDVDWLSQKLETMKLNKYSEASAQPGLSANKIMRLLILKPLFEEQNEISKRLISIDNKLQTEQNYLHKLQQIKAGLMADLLSGKKKVNVDEETVN